jgi:hypothetical protein
MSRTRAVSTTLGYVLTLAIAAILVTGLITAGGAYVENEREQVIRDELTVIGQQLAADVERTDRLVRASEGSTTVRLNQSFSDRVTGTAYRISLDDTDDEVVVSSVDPNVTVSVRVQTETPMRESTAGGGPIQLVYQSGELEVQNV